jgi:AraC-like DNA-binding protein
MVNIEPSIRALGFDPEPVFAEASLDISCFRDPETLVTYPQAGRLFAAAAAHTRCSHFGLQVGSLCQPSQLGIAGLMMYAAPTVGQALEALVSNLDLHDRGGTARLDVDDAFAHLSFNVLQRQMPALDHVYDLCAAIMCNVLRALCGESWAATEVLLPRRRPEDSRPYVRILGNAIRYNAEYCAASFPRHLLARPVQAANAVLFQHLQHEADYLHNINAIELVAMLPSVIRQGLMLKKHSARDIAASFGLLERTFHRRLEAAGTTFRRELDQERETMSLQLLENTSLPVCDIAVSLGYADSTAFIRAFRRWTGTSPNAWRKRESAHSGE